MSYNADYELHPIQGTLYILKPKNELCHLFEIKTFDHKDNVWPGQLWASFRRLRGLVLVLKLFLVGVSTYSKQFEHSN